jgi:hypothetical protein
MRALRITIVAIACTPLVLYASAIALVLVDQFVTMLR